MASEGLDKGLGEGTDKGSGEGTGDVRVRWSNIAREDEGDSA